MAKAGNGEPGNPQGTTKRHVQSDRQSRTEPGDVENAWRSDAFGRSLFQVLPAWDSPSQCTRLPGFRFMMLDVRSLQFRVLLALTQYPVAVGDVLTFRMLAELLEIGARPLAESLEQLLAANCNQIQDFEGKFLFEVKHG